MCIDNLSFLFLFFFFFYFWQFETRYARGLRGDETWGRRNEMPKGQEAEKALAAALIYFCEILETLCCKEVLPSDWRSPFIILDSYLGPKEKECVLYILSIKYFQILCRAKSVMQMTSCPERSYEAGASLDPDELCTLVWGHSQSAVFTAPSLG